MASQVESIKWVQGTSFMVDGFAFANNKCSHYFLTHCHSDHTIGLGRDFCAGTIYCSAVSARLLALEKGLHSPLVQVLPIERPVVIDGVTVTAIDANHCPGALMLLFEVPNQADSVRAGLASDVTRILHTGDCRWRDELWSGSCLAHKPVDILMLDTTYAIPRYTFPPQEQAIQMMVQVMREALVEEPSSLFVVGSYHIGKERAYLGAAQALGIQVYAPASKRRVLELLDLPSQQLQLLTADKGAQLHVGSMGSNPANLKPYLQEAGCRWKRVVGFRPTGWSFRSSGGLQVWRDGSAAVYGVPYSEHSSFNELRACVGTLKPKKLIPTVNASNKKSAAAIIDRFADLMDLQLQRSRIDFYLNKGGSRGSSSCGCGSGATAVETAVDAVGALRQQQVGLIEPGEQSSTCPHAGDAFDAAVQQGSELYDLSAVDLAEQQRLLDQAHRLQRLKRSVELQVAAKKKQRLARQAFGLSKTRSA
eukprot:gene12755-12884_t